MHIVSYLRVSDRHQVSGDGFDRQRDTIERWRRSRLVDDDCVLVREFVEMGHTGTEFDRPALGNLLEFCRRWHALVTAMPGDTVEVAGIDDPVWQFPMRGRRLCVVVERSDRLARDNLVAELILQEFKKYDVWVYDCEADINLTLDDDPSKVLIRQILQAVSQFEKSSIVQKLRRARDRKRARDGRCEGAKPFGYYDNEKVALQHILEGAKNGLTPGQIALYLNSQIKLDVHELRPRRGSRWNRGTIHKIIQANRSSQPA